MEELHTKALQQPHAVKIAVIEEQIAGLRAQQMAHNASTQHRFDAVEAKIDELTAIMNRGRGAYAASMALAAAGGAVLIESINLLTSLIPTR